MDTSDEPIGTDGQTVDNGSAADQASTSSGSPGGAPGGSLFSWAPGSASSLPSVDDEATMSDGSSFVSSVRGSALSTTMSARASIFDFVVENGRTYHRFREGKYPLPNDAAEQDRLDLQHQLFLLTLNMKLNLAPIPDNLGRVMDMATGTGIWAIDFAQQHPGSEVIGTDLSPIQPAYVPANCRFEIDDAEDEWVYSQPFDYIHGRAILSCFKDPGEVIRECFKNLWPGGWLEFQDGVFPMCYVGEIPTGSYLYRWNDLLLEGSAKMGRPWDNVQHYNRWFHEAGFENVVERRFYWPTNHWAKGPYFKTIAAYLQEDLLGNLEGISMRVLGSLGWSGDRMREFLEGVRRDFTDPNIHAYITILCIYGRKPLQPA